MEIRQHVSRNHKPMVGLESVYLTIIARGRVGYKMIDSQRGA